MPYASNDELQPSVKARYSDRCLTVYREVFNATERRTHDEGRSFATAETAAKQCKAAGKAVWSTAYVNDLPDSAFACPEQRKYPHHNANGGLDLAHLRNALSRVAQEDTETCGVQHLRSHAKEAGVGKSTDEATTTVSVDLVPTAVKFADGSDNIIEGLAIPYGGPWAGKDLHGEAFGPETDLALEWFPDEGRPFLYHHGLDGSVKAALVGRQIEREEMDIGQWVKVQLDKRNRHYEGIRQLVDEGSLFFSSGSMPHLVQTRKDGFIERWPWVELSGTPTPANDWAGAYAVKMADAIEHLAAVKAPIPDVLREAVDESLEATLAGLPYADHADRVLADVKALVTRSQEIADLRAKAGRRISAATRDRLAAVREQAQQVTADIDALLAEAIPEAQAAKDRSFLEVLALTH